MNLLNYFAVFVFVSVVGYLYNKWDFKNKENDVINEYDLVNKFLLGNLDKSKPYLWIYVSDTHKPVYYKSEVSEYIKSFYIELCVRSIIKHCGDSFNVVLINDDSINKLIQDWSINMNILDDPIKYNVRQLAISKILLKYGGLVVPETFICKKNLIDLYNNYCKKTFFVFEKYDFKNSNLYVKYNCSNKFMGSCKSNESLNGYIRHLEYILSTDNTCNSAFEDNINKYLDDLSKRGEVILLNGKLIGIKDQNDEFISIEDLFSDKYIDFSDAYGICLMNDEIKKRTKYNWLLDANINSLKESNLHICKELLLCI